MRIRFAGRRKVLRGSGLWGVECGVLLRSPQPLETEGSGSVGLGA